ncbi:MAG: hypothetical protein QOH38_55 [Thermoleophilaceae bacterium]|nr:hypothetical protein [Thermoleophilaceae bacterium]
MYPSVATDPDSDGGGHRERHPLERIAKVLRSLGAVLRGAPADVPFQLDARTLAAGTFSTSLGSIDILADPAGGPPYERLKADAMTIEVPTTPVRARVPRAGRAR